MDANFGFLGARAMAPPMRVRMMWLAGRDRYWATEAGKIAASFSRAGREDDLKQPVMQRATDLLKRSRGLKEAGGSGRKQETP
jgi:hypothetical protein